MEGLPGTGKSFLLDTARAAWAAAGYRVVGAALSSKTAQGCKESAGIPSATLHARLKEWAPEPGTAAGEQRWTPKRWWWWTRPAWWTAGNWRRWSRSPKPPAPSWCWWAIIANSNPHRGRWPVPRPTERIETPHERDSPPGQPWAREAVDAIAEVGSARHWPLMKARFCPGRREQSRHRARPGHALGQGGRTTPTASRLMLAGERADVRALNAAARDHLQQAGQLGTGQPIATAHGPREFAVGDQLVCTRNSTSTGPQRQLGTVEGWRAPAKGGPPGAAGRWRPASRIAAPALSAHRSWLRADHPQSPRCDRGSCVRAGGRKTGRPEIGLVQLSRHRESAHLFVDRSFG